jgi:hypothetical protein
LFIAGTAPTNAIYSTPMYNIAIGVEKNTKYNEMVIGVCNLPMGLV